MLRFAYRRSVTIFASVTGKPHDDNHSTDSTRNKKRFYSCPALLGQTHCRKVEAVPARADRAVLQFVLPGTGAAALRLHMGERTGWLFQPGFRLYRHDDVPALAGLIIATVAFMTIPVATASDREQKLLRRYQVTPMRPIVYFTADVSVYFGVALVGVALLIVVAKLAFGLRFDGDWVAVLAGFTLSLLAFISLGYIIASLAPTSQTGPDSRDGGCSSR